MRDRCGHASLAAIDAFDQAVPDANLLRHIHEHFDAYASGRGREQRKLPRSIEESAVGMLDKGLAYYIGGKLFLLWEITTQAEELARTVAECVVPKDT